MLGKKSLVVEFYDELVSIVIMSHEISGLKKIVEN
jgi:hypothetical protein